MEDENNTTVTCGHNGIYVTTSTADVKSKDTTSDDDSGSWKEKFKVSIQKLDDWDVARLVARRTVNKPDLDSDAHPVTEDFKNRLIVGEHSPIRTVKYLVYLENVPTWVSQHLARHDKYEGHFMREGEFDEPYVGTQRSDRTGIDRHKLSQDNPCNHTIYLSAADFINTSKLRLCHKASEETRWVWQQIIAELNKTDHELAVMCVPQCVYRGICPECNGCGWDSTADFSARRGGYMDHILMVTKNAPVWGSD